MQDMLSTRVQDERMQNPEALFLVILCMSNEYKAPPPPANW